MTFHTLCLAYLKTFMVKSVRLKSLGKSISQVTFQSPSVSREKLTEKSRETFVTVLIFMFSFVRVVAWHEQCNVHILIIVIAFLD